MVLQADLQPLSPGRGVYTGGSQGAPEGYFHVCLIQRSSLVLSIASLGPSYLRREVI